MLRNVQLPRTGELIDGKFCIVRQLGAGGMGVVFEAVNRTTERHVALKFLSPALCAAAEAVERFKREAKATARIHHPNVVAVQDFGEHDGRVFLVMELLRGVSLREWLADRTVSLEAACKVLFPVMRGVAAAHDVGVLHRDLKPDNIFMAKSSDGLAPTPKVLDFGLAKLTSTADGYTTELSVNGTAMGTYQFMSPEQLRSQSDIDVRADVYAIGAVLFTMLAGTTPYRADNPIDLALQILQSDAPALDSLIELPSAAAKVVARALARDRNARYESIEALAHNLEPFAGGLMFRGGAGRASAQPSVFTAPGAPGLERVSTAPLATPFGTGSYAAEAVPFKRKRLGLWLALGITMGAAVVGSNLVREWRSERPDPRPAPLPTAPAIGHRSAAGMPKSPPLGPAQPMDLVKSSNAPEVPAAPAVDRNAFPAWPDEHENKPTKLKRAKAVRVSARRSSKRHDSHTPQPGSQGIQQNVVREATAISPNASSNGARDSAIDQDVTSTSPTALRSRTRTKLTPDQF